MSRGRVGSMGLTLNVTGGNYTNGTKIQNWRYLGSNKVGIADSGAGNGTYKIFFWEHPEKCLDNPGSQTANGTRLQMYDCSANNPWQQWAITVDPDTAAASFKNMGSGKCIDDTGSTSPGTKPWIWDCNTSNVNQKWRVTGGWWRPYGTSFQVHSGDAYTLLAGNGNGNTALDTGGASTNGSILGLASAVDPDKANQVMFTSTGSNTYKISFVNNPNKCLDHPLSSADGTVMQVWDCNGGTNQNWTLSSAQNGSIQIQNQWSGKCLWNGAITPNDRGSPVMTWTCGANNSGTPDWNQIWQLVTYN